MENSDNYLLLYASCFPVKGANRSLIVDTGRSQLFFISNHYYEVIADARTRKWAEVLNEYDEDSQMLLAQLVEFLEKNDLGFWTDDPELFPAIELQWDAPALITNAIIDSDTLSNHDWNRIISELLKIGCRDIQLRFFNDEKPSVIEEILQSLAGSYVKSVEIFVKFRKEYTRRRLIALVDKYTRIKTIVVHSCPRDVMIRHHNFSNFGQMGNVLMVRQAIVSSDHCGFVDSNYFTYFTVQNFAEFRNHNSCLNRKIGIDIAGNVKNCPAMPRVFGNIATDALEDLITDEFKEIWNVTKDQIEVCKVCEFRYICPDCRAFVKEPLSKPLKCTYDPYTAEWK
jgi:SPASM domain peptide maturase of grasp-with-spasm system